jgi:S-adenosylmethionine decarboxylase
MQGLHLTADLLGCAPAVQGLLQDAEALRALALDAVRDCGLNPMRDVFHPFAPPGGVTGVVLLAESHLALHTWPELGAVTLDVYVCNVSGDHSERAQALMDCLLKSFAPAVSQRHRLARGELMGAAG